MNFVSTYSNYIMVLNEIGLKHTYTDRGHERYNVIFPERISQDRRYFLILYRRCSLNEKGEPVGCG